jgi:hypothetical protein
MIKRANIHRLDHHANSYWIDYLVYSRSIALSPAVSVRRCFRLRRYRRE